MYDAPDRVLLCLSLFSRNELSNYTGQSEAHTNTKRARDTCVTQSTYSNFRSLAVLNRTFPSHTNQANRQAKEHAVQMSRTEYNQS